MAWHIYALIKASLHGLWAHDPNLWCHVMPHVYRNHPQTFLFYPSTVMYRLTFPPPTSFAEKVNSVHLCLLQNSWMGRPAQAQAS